jgi:hypothetical protein
MHALIAYVVSVFTKVIGKPHDIKEITDVVEILLQLGTSRV